MKRPSTMMNVYQIYFPELGLYVKFKALGAEEVSAFVESCQTLNTHEYKKKVLETFVYNIRSEVLDVLSKMSAESSQNMVNALYNGCVQLNPALDVDKWIACSHRGIDEPAHKNAGWDEGIELEPDTTVETESTPTPYDAKKIKPFQLERAKFAAMRQHLDTKVIGQPEALDALESVLRRSQAGLADDGRPLGVFMFCGPSGVGKTHIAKELHNYLFGADYDIVRIDCGEFQHKHENQKLTGAPPGYIGFGQGGTLTNAVMEHPYTVILIDEIEKADIDVFNTFLRVFDEGSLTDGSGREVNFKNTVIIMTSNLGNDKVVSYQTDSGVGFNAGAAQTKAKLAVPPPRDLVVRQTNEAVKKKFTPEFLNRIDEIVVTNHLSYGDFLTIAELEFSEIDRKIAKRGYILSYDQKALEGLVELGVDSVKGARGMAQIRRRKIEDLIATAITTKRIPRGAVFSLSYANEAFLLKINKPLVGKEKS